MGVITTEARNRKADRLCAALYAEIAEVCGAEDRLPALLERAMSEPEAVSRELAGADNEELDRFSHYYTILHTLRTYAPVLLRREREVREKEAIKRLTTAIKALKAAGYTLSQALTFLEEVKISKSATPHPTEHLSREGVALCRELVQAAEREDPEGAVRKVIKKMVAAGSFAASQKNGILDEIDASNVDSRIHNAGAYRLNRQIKDILKELYQPEGAELDSVEDLVMDFHRRSWDYDSDGKNNAEGWATMAKLSTTKYEFFKDLEDALEVVCGQDADGCGEAPKALLDDVRRVMAALYPVYKMSRHIAKTLAEITDPKEREAFYRAHYPKFEEEVERFSDIYVSVESLDAGWDFFQDVNDTLADLRRNRFAAGAKDSGEAVDQVLFVMNRNGFGLDKAQPRQNDYMHANAIDNFFFSTAFRNADVLPAGDFKEIDDASGICNLPLDRQYAIFSKVVEFADKKDADNTLQQYLFDANPLRFSSGNGFPDQERTLLDRFKLRSIFKRMFDQGIISDCQDAGSVRQKFIADLFGIKDMHHMPLHEDRLNLMQQAELLTDHYNMASEPTRRKVKELVQNIENLDKYIGGRGIHETHIMRPCSDAEKGGGSGTRQEAMDVYRKIVRLSLELFEEKGEAVPIEIMLGCGFSMQRYGGNPEIIRSVVEQELKLYSLERRSEGNTLNPREDKNDRRLLRSALAILWTEQGRARRVMTASAGQIADDFANYVTRMIEGRLDIERCFGDVYNYITPPTVTLKQRERRTRYYNSMIKAYESFRNTRYPGGGTVLDAVSGVVTYPLMCGMANFASRPASKAIGSDKRTEKRAIENNLRDYISKLFLNRYGSGNLLQTLYLDYRCGSLSAKELNRILTDPEWTYNLFIKDVADAMRTDYTQALEDLGWSATFDELVALGKKVQCHKPPGKPETLLRHPPGFTAEEAYLAKAYYDYVLFVALLESALSDRFEDDLDAIVDAAKPVSGVKLSVGPQTRKAYPEAVEIAEESARNEVGAWLVRTMEKRVQRIQEEESVDRRTAVEMAGGEPFLRRIASAWRSGTLPHWKYWSGELRCLPHNPEPKTPLEVFAESAE